MDFIHPVICELLFIRLKPMPGSGVEKLTTGALNKPCLSIDRLILITTNSNLRYHSWPMIDRRLISIKLHHLIIKYGVIYHNNQHIKSSIECR